VNIAASIVLLAPADIQKYSYVSAASRSRLRDRVIVGHAYRIIERSGDGFRLLVDLSRAIQAGAIAAVERCPCPVERLIGFSG